MPRLTNSEVDEALAGIEGWRREGDALVREFALADFVAALGFVVQVGALAERANHHPTITNTYNRVRLDLTTHDEGGITEHDVELAREISARI